MSPVSRNLGVNKHCPTHDTLICWKSRRRGNGGVGLGPGVVHNTIEMFLRYTWRGCNMVINL